MLSQHIFTFNHIGFLEKSLRFKPIGQRKMGEILAKIYYKKVKNGIEVDYSEIIS